MLNPHDRALLLESLRPPDGFTLDRAIGTSYSLDLLALLAAPLAFTFFDWEDEGGQPTSDPLLLLEAVRRHAGRIRIFCQAGEIKVPKANQRLIGYLEKSVVAVCAPREGGVFHPKVWALRYVAPDQVPRYRMLCLSRNLTFDKCWDTVLVLDGQVSDRQRGYSENRPLADFFAALPGLAVHPMATEDQTWINEMAQEMRKVAFEPPADVDQLRFWPMGLAAPGKLPFLERRKRALVMAPFLSSAFLDDFVEDRPDCILISRADQLAALPRSTLDRFKQIYALDPAAEELQCDSEDGDPSLAGLHAKLFVEDDGWDTRIYTGSANATSAAFSKNVEFLVELTAKRSRLGIDAMLTQAAGTTSFLSLLRPWHAGDVPPSEDADAKLLEKRLSEIRRQIAGMRLSIEVEARDTQFVVRIMNSVESSWPEGLQANIWLSSLRPDTAQAVQQIDQVLATFSSLGLDALTGFVVFEVSAKVGRTEGKSRFVVCLPMIGAPGDRMDRLLASLLQDKDQVRRLLWMLLQGQKEVFGLIGNQNSLDGKGQQFNVFAGYPLFEQLIRAMADRDGQLGELGRLVEDLARTDEGRAVLPEGFLTLWESIRTALGNTSAPPGPA